MMAQNIDVQFIHKRTHLIAQNLLNNLVVVDIKEQQVLF